MNILKCKPWQIFSVLLTPFLITSIFGEFLSYNEYVYYGNIMLMVYYFLFLTWLFQIGKFLKNNNKNNPVGSFSQFGFNVLFVFFYALMIFYLGIILRDRSLFDALNNPYLLILIPVILYGTYANLYIFYYVSKTLTVIELNKEVELRQYAGAFILLLLCPFTSWFIQSKVKRLMND